MTLSASKGYLSREKVNNPYFSTEKFFKKQITVFQKSHTGAAKRSFQHFLQNTTLHGLKYVAESNITIFERTFFGLSFFCVVFVSGFFISNIYSRWAASPIIITTNPKQMLTSDIPFPAITICNLNLALKSKVAKIPRYSSNFSLLLSLCNQNGDAYESIGTWRYFKSILVEVAQPCSEMMLYCSFGAEVEICSTMFSTVLTDDGLCCSFNALSAKYMLRNSSEENQFSDEVEGQYIAIDWTPERGYEGLLPEYFYPRTSGGTGSHMGLTIMLNSSSAEYYCSKSKSFGFKILVHNPAELPKINNYGFLVTTGREYRIPITPIYEDAVPSIRSIKQDVRKCLFSDEGSLTYYRTYSFKNCQLECEAKFIMEKCKCILYFLPRIDPSMRICGPNDNLCTKRVQDSIESSSKNLSCSDCLPGCFELNYEFDSTSATISYDEFLSASEFPTDLIDTKEKIANVSIMHFYYVTNIMRSTRKSEMFGLTEFLSNTGGLLSLFMGFSVFSLIEIVFYVTVRPLCASRIVNKSKQAYTNSTKLKTQSNLSKISKTRYKTDPDTFVNPRGRKPIETILPQKNDFFMETELFPYVD